MGSDLAWRPRWESDTWVTQEQIYKDQATKAEARVLQLEEELGLVRAQLEATQRRLVQKKRRKK